VIEVRLNRILIAGHLNWPALEESLRTLISIESLQDGIVDFPYLALDGYAILVPDQAGISSRSIIEPVVR
jgi:hypothetical protein